ncbi:uncharacterized protein HMPREF1541_07192 [Cyphellophora europaea CBS 101466]|uniref:Glycoside hydrolase family 125 protein n=1 Tax=Cyphellophora europaea (strain CBS 101466) TaxID=1220924 RepID=W2RML9_CYPE1|nr:uncharacterized protein HMPREF1541_07192 [Cyphellophora europaea CBS 101466]ETN37570.1 hypothetical protein HMPREF1541_07192 [Cyphellophora europaea CBS 101466]
MASLFVAGLSLFALTSRVVSLDSEIVFNGTCPDYVVYAGEHHGPYSEGAYNLSFQRPPLPCRTWNSTEVEDTVERMRDIITDPDLYRVFQNSFPNTLDTAIRWHGVASNNSEEELTFIITGDINAMWLRDSANQLQSYLPLLTANSSIDSLASLFRGCINLQSRYINTSPHCNAFQPPEEAGLGVSENPYSQTDEVTPPYSNQSVFECKYELDSISAFLQISHQYYITTSDLKFFDSFQWVDTVRTILNTAYDLMNGTYAPDGQVLEQPYTFERETTSGTETLPNEGRGNPVRGGTGLIRSAFRPSDDSSIYQLFIPANMMFSYFLSTTADIMAQLSHPDAPTLAPEMTSLAAAIRAAIDAAGLTLAPSSTSYSNLTQIYAFEVDGFGSANVMDDANIPSLLAAPFFGYDVADPRYQATRAHVLSEVNSYFMRGPVISAVGGPHQSFGMAWPMASIVRIITAGTHPSPSTPLRPDGNGNGNGSAAPAAAQLDAAAKAEIRQELRQLVASTDGYGLMHESVNSWNESDWTRQWFSWANGLFGQMVLGLEGTGLLEESYQPE